MKKKKIIIGALFCVMSIGLFTRFALAEANSISLITNYVAVTGDEKRFRQNLWMDDGLNGGIENLNLKEDFGDGKSLIMEGRALSDSDYNLLMNFEKKEYGYMTLKYDQFRKYYDDTGFFHIFPTAGRPSWYELGRDLHTDRSVFSLDFGLTLPDRPKYTLGYERKTKSGELPSEYGLVRDNTPAPDDYNYLYPNTKNVDWVVDSLKAGMEFQLKEVNIAISPKYEMYSNNVFRNNVADIQDNARPVYTNRIREEKPAYQSGSLSLLADSQINEKLFMKGGYLFNSMAGKVKWDRIDSRNATPIYTRYYNAEEESDTKNNILNWGADFKLLKGLMLTSGARYESFKMTSFSQYNQAGTTNRLRKNYNEDTRTILGESIGLRYTALPRTSIYADVELEQNQQQEYEYRTDNMAFRAQVNADKDFNKDVYTVGMNTRPIKPVFISSRYRRISKDNDYTDYGAEGVLGNNSRVTDEYTVRTDIKPNKLVAFNVKYQNSQTNYNLSREPAGGIATFDSQTTSLGVTLTPTPKLYINSLYSMQDAMIKNIGAEAIVNTPQRTNYFNGDSSSSITSVNYALDDKTTVNSQYQWWVADGVDAVSKIISLGVERSLPKDLVLKVGYSYDTYDQGENYGLDDYKANIVYTSLTGKF